MCGLNEADVVEGKEDLLKSIGSFRGKMLNVECSRLKVPKQERGLSILMTMRCSDPGARLLLCGRTSFIVFKFLSNIIGGGNGLMRVIKLSAFVGVVFALGILSVGCSKPPEAEKEAAKKAMGAAFSAGADQYAPADLEAANKIWDTAESQMKGEKYKEAKESYIGAKAAFEKAAAAVESGKKAAADQAKAEKEAAKKAMDAALSAGADQYASADLEVARKVWNTGESQLKEEKYREARGSYIEAKAAFEKAAAAVEAGKRAVADQAKAALKTLEAEWEKLRATAKKMEKKLKDKKQAWTADTKAIKEGLGRAKKMIASAPVEAKAKLDELKATIDRWEATFKEMAKSPSKAEATKKKK